MNNPERRRELIENWMFEYAIAHNIEELFEPFMKRLGNLGMSNDGEAAIEGQEDAESSLLSVPRQMRTNFLMIDLYSSQAHFDQWFYYFCELAPVDPQENIEFSDIFIDLKLWKYIHEMAQRKRAAESESEDLLDGSQKRSSQRRRARKAAESVTGESNMEDSPEDDVNAVMSATEELTEELVEKYFPESRPSTITNANIQERYKDVRRFLLEIPGRVSGEKHPKRVQVFLGKYAKRSSIVERAEMWLEKRRKRIRPAFLDVVLDDVLSNFYIPSTSVESIPVGETRNKMLEQSVSLKVLKDVFFTGDETGWHSVIEQSNEFIQEFVKKTRAGLHDGVEDDQNDQVAHEHPVESPEARDESILLDSVIVPQKMSAHVTPMKRRQSPRLDNEEVRKRLKNSVDALADSVEDPLGEILANEGEKVRKVGTGVLSSRKRTPEGRFRTFSPIQESGMVQLPTPKKKDFPKQIAKSSNRRRRRLFTKEEVDNLLQGAREFGYGNWAIILDNYPFNNRTSVDLKDKYRNLAKNNKSLRMVDSDE